MPAMDVMLVVIVMVVVLVLAILYAMQIKSSGEEQTFKLGSRMDIVGPGSTEKSVDCSGDECHYTITANDIRFELESGKEQSFDMVAIADYADSGRNRHLIYAGYDTSITYGPIIPISSSDLTTPCSSNYVYKLHDCAGGHHPALDLYAPCGTPIRATCGGYLTKEHRNSFCSEDGDYEYVKIVNDGNCKDSDGSNDYTYYNTYYAGITIRDDISEEVDKNGHATVSQGEIIGYVDTDTPNYEPGCHLHFIITNDANFLNSRTDPAFVCSRDQHSNGPTIINYQNDNDNTVDLVFDFYDNPPPENKFLHITFWACVKDKNGNCACIDDYMSKNDKKLNELIDGCPSFYIGSVDASIVTTPPLPLPGVTLYNDVDYSGSSTLYAADVNNIGNTGWASSAKVSSGMAGILFTNPDYYGAYIVLTSDTPDFALRDVCFDNQARSIKVMSVASAPTSPTGCTDINNPCILIPNTGSGSGGWSYGYSVITSGARYWKLTLDNGYRADCRADFVSGDCIGRMKIGSIAGGSDIYDHVGVSAGASVFYGGNMPAGTYYITTSCDSGCGVTRVRCDIS